MSAPESTFYVTGGTLRQDAPSYVERQADRDLFDGLLKGEFCYVLTSRQMGKSSLMVRTAGKLREQGVHVVVLDLTAIGQNLTPEQWYDGLLVRMGRQLDLEDELEEFWGQHEQLGPCQRLVAAIRDVVLRERAAGVPPAEASLSTANAAQGHPASGTLAARSLVLFVDEIDVVRSLPFSTDEFFAAIRECYNRRTEDAEFNRLTFCLLGVATPSDLIRDTRTTPFNIGRRIELNDFTQQEAAPLAGGLQVGKWESGRKAPWEPRPFTGKVSTEAQALLNRVLYWTNGHPYLTQRLCQAIAAVDRAKAPREVDGLCDALFFSSRAKERDDNLLFVRERMLRNEADPASLLHIYEQVRAHKRVRDDETNPQVSLLRLSGITRVVEGYLWVRNRIYYRVFDREWVRANMPDAEVRRQKEAFRRGVIRASAIAAALVAAFAALSLFAFRQSQLAKENERAASRNLYVADMNLAVQALESDNRGHAMDLLKKHIPKPDEEDLRGFEWRYVWRQCSGDSAFTLHGHSNNVRYVFFSPDGASLASRSMDNVVKVWDLVTRRERCTLTNATALAGFTPDGSSVVIGKKEGLVLFCDAQTGRSGRSLQTDGLLVRLLADGQTVVTTSTNYAVKFWDFSTGLGNAVVPGEGGSWKMADSESLYVAVSSDGKRALVKTRNRGYQDGFDIAIWEIASLARLRFLPWFLNPRDANFSRDGRLVAQTSISGAVWVWDTTSDEEPRIIQTGDATVWSVSFSPDGQRLATASSDQTVRVWSTGAGTLLLTLKGHENGVQSVAFSPDGRWLASGGRDETIRLWNLSSQTANDVLTNIASLVVFTQDGKLIAARATDETVKIWNAATLQEKATIQLNAVPLEFSQDGKSLLLLDDEKLTTVDLQNAGAWKTVPITGGLTNVSYSVYCSQRRLLASRSGGTLRLHETSTGRELAVAVLPAQPGPVQPLAFSPDGTSLAAAGGDGTIAFWDALLRREQAVVSSHKYFTSSLAFSPDGKWLASGGGDNTIQLWDVATRSLRGTLKGHRQYVAALVLSPDGKTLASSSSDGRVRFWNLALQQEVANFKFHQGESKGVNVGGLAFSPDGNTLAVRGGPYTMKIWRAPSFAEIEAKERANTHPQ